MMFYSTLAWPQGAVTDLVVGPIPIAHKAVLTQALGEVAIRVQDGFTSFGVAVADPEPVVQVYFPKATNLGDAVQRIVAQVPGYAYEAVSAHLIDVYPVSIKSDPNHPLNVAVGKFEIKDLAAMDLFANPARYVPELRAFQNRDKPLQACGGIGPGLGSSSSASIRLNLSNVTLKQILDAAATADSSLREQAATRTQPPVGWVLRSKIDPDGKRKDEWSFMATVPHNWRALLAQ
jgi:hypothetical protein